MDDAEQQSTAPSFDEFCWATAIAGSRAYRVRGAPGAKEGDVARLLPIIDLANYAVDGCANAELRNAPTDGPGASSPDDPLAVSMVASRPINAGDEILIDYGCGASLSNERLLLEYGFTLDDHPHDTLELPFGAIAVGLAAVEDSEDEMATPPPAGEAAEEEMGRLAERQQALLAQLGDIEGNGLIFNADGSPTDDTLALAYILTARTSDELKGETPLELVEAVSSTGGEALLDGSRASIALGAVASEALDQVKDALEQGGEPPPAEDGDEAGGFEAAAHTFCKTRLAILERAVEALSA